MKGMRMLAAAAILLVAAVAQAKQPAATGHGGAVATISDEASHAALEILDAGGNAVDAAVAAAAVLGVTDPFSCGIGGGGFMLIYSAKDRRVIALDHRETAPAAVTPALFQVDGKELSWDDAVPTGLSIGVPGTVRGWHEALSRYGTMKLSHLLQPAIRVAERGWPVSPAFHDFIVGNEAKFSRFTSTSDLYLKYGKALPVGSHFRNPDLAATYRLIAKGGVKAFYEGRLAEDIVRTVNQPPAVPGVRVAGARMTLNDLKDYEARIRQPVRSTYRGHEFYGFPPPSSGGIALAEALNILEHFDLKSLPRAAAEHLYLEASRLAFADRNAYVADPEYIDVPVAGLLSRAFAAQRAALIDPRTAHGVAAAGDPYAFQDDPSVPLRPRPQSAAEATHTTHLAVADREGNIVAYTFTIEDWGGSGIVVPGRGFLLNNELTDFDFSAPHPNVPEAIKRPRSSMTPTIVFKDGRPAFTIGAPGGATIITTVLQTVVNHLDLGMSLAEAVAAPRMSQRNAALTDVEPGFAGSAQARALEAFGHAWAEPESIGLANGIRFNDDGTVTAVSEPRRGGGGSALVQRQ